MLIQKFSKNCSFSYVSLFFSDKTLLKTQKLTYVVKNQFNMYIHVSVGVVSFNFKIVVYWTFPTEFYVDINQSTEIVDPNTGYCNLCVYYFN